SARLEWEREFIEYLLAERKDAESQALIAKVEQELNGLYPRPEWLRLANARIEVRRGQMELAIPNLKRFALIETGPRVDHVSVPNLQRLNDAAAMLRSEKREAEAGELLKAAYERTLAMEQLQPAPLIGLARLAFETGDPQRGLKLLKLMIALGQSANREVAAAELAAFDWVKSRAIMDQSIEAPQTANQIDEPEALRLAAECAAEFGQFAFAIECRERLLAISPSDAANKIELARTQSAAGSSDQAIITLVSVIAEPLATRQARWTAVWMAAEIAGSSDALWQSLESRGRSSSKDSEMTSAIETLAKYHGNRVREAVEVAKQSPSNQSQLLAVILEKNAGQPREALQTLTRSMIQLSDSSPGQPFSATEDEPRWLLVRFYAASAQPRSALRLAGADEKLKGQPLGNLNDLEIKDDAGSKPQARQQEQLLLLTARSSEHQRQSLIELLALLSNAAEQIDDWTKAIEFERAR